MSTWPDFMRKRGAFTFLRKTGRKSFAGGLAWVLIIGYVLTLSVYAFTFGHYLAEAFGIGGFFARAAALGIIAALVFQPPRISESAGFEIVAVWGKLAVLAALAGAGLWFWHPERLPQVCRRAASAGRWSALRQSSWATKASSFGLRLPCHPGTEEDLAGAVPLAIVVVIAVYVAVALGTAR